MGKAVFAALSALAPGTLPGCDTARGDPSDDYDVIGVETGDMLKLRAGPGAGFDIIAGVPNGSILRAQSCERTGGTRWCKVSLKEARSLDGCVSWAYLREA